MQVTVRLFAVVREAAGISEISLQLPDGATVARAKAALAERHAGIRPHIERLAFAVNREYAQLDTPLHDGDELALIPPVSGG